MFLGRPGFNKATRARLTFMTAPQKENPYASPSTVPDRQNLGESVGPEDLSVDVHHVYSAFHFAIAERMQSDDDEVNLSARDICQMVLSLACRMTAYDSTGDEALAYLTEMNIRTSEDVGLAVGILQQLGLTFPSEGDHPSDFQGLFDLDTPVPEWTLPFDLAAEMAFAKGFDG